MASQMIIKASKITACKECGSTALTWQTSIINRSDVQQGRLNTRDVECVFFLGCDDCSETLTMVSADKVAGLMNAQVGQDLASDCEALRSQLFELVTLGFNMVGASGAKRKQHTDTLTARLNDLQVQLGTA